MIPDANVETCDLNEGTQFEVREYGKAAYPSALLPAAGAVHRSDCQDQNGEAFTIHTYTYMYIYAQKKKLRKVSSP